MISQILTAGILSLFGFSGNVDKISEAAGQIAKADSARNAEYRKSLAEATLRMYDDNVVDIDYGVYEKGIVMRYKVEIPKLSSTADIIRKMYKKGAKEGLNRYVVYFIISVRMQCTSMTATGYIEINGDIKYSKFIRNRPDEANEEGVSGSYIINKGVRSCQYTDKKMPVVKIAFAVSNDNDKFDRIDNLTSCLIHDTQDRFTIDKPIKHQDTYEKINAYNCDAKKTSFINRYEIYDSVKVLTYSHWAIN